MVVQCQLSVCIISTNKNGHEQDKSHKNLFSENVESMNEDLRSCKKWHLLLKVDAKQQMKELGNQWKRKVLPWCNGYWLSLDPTAQLHSTKVELRFCTEAHTQVQRILLMACQRFTMDGGEDYHYHFNSSSSIQLVAVPSKLEIQCTIKHDVFFI